MIDEFTQARDYIFSTIAQKVEVFLTGMWDPMVKYVIIKETTELVHKEIKELFPSIPSRYIPQVRFKIFEAANHIEVGVQNYINKERNLIFLGTNDLDSTPFDYYVRDSYDPRFDYIFMARYGHTEDSIYRGSKTAEAEYFLGQMTPLSVAYGMAVEDGFIQ